MGTPPTPASGPQPANRDAALKPVAEEMEKAFNAIDRTLTDEETARVFRHTLGLVEHALRGAAAHGILTDAQRQELAVLIGGMKAVPGLV